MSPGTDAVTVPLRTEGPPRRQPRSHEINLCCAVSVEPIVSEISRALDGLGFTATVVCGAAARASLLGGDEITDDRPTIHVVCVQGQLRDRVMGPLRRALADRDRPNQHLFVAVLDLTMPLTMVGQIRRFADTLESPLNESQSGVGGAERRQWREVLGGRPPTETPIREYRPLQVIDRTPDSTAATASDEPAGEAPASEPAPKPRRRRTFTATGRVTRVEATGKYEAIAAGHVTQADDDDDDDDTVELTTPSSHTKTARYRIEDMLDTGPQAAVDSIGADPDGQTVSPRVGLASLLIDGPQPATADGADALAQTLLADPGPPAPMAKLALRRKPTGTFQIVEKPTKRSAVADPRAEPDVRPLSSPINRPPHKPNPPARPTTPLPAVPVSAEPPAEASEPTPLPGPVAKVDDSENLDTDPDGEAFERSGTTSVGIETPIPERARPRIGLWLGVAAVVAALGWMAFRNDASVPPNSSAPPPAPAKATPDATAPIAAPLRTERPALVSPPIPTETESPPASAVVPRRTPPSSSSVSPVETPPPPAGPGRTTPPPPPADNAADTTASPPADVAAALAAAVESRRVRRIGNLHVFRPREPATGTWGAAVEHCTDLRVAGVSGWRLPWRKELKSVAIGLGLRAGVWWSRSKVAEDPDMVYGLDARDRNLGEYMKAEAGQTLCVHR